MSDNNITIGSHTLTHPRLKSIDRPSACQEIAISKIALESLTGKPVHFFAYPYGQYTKEIERIVKDAGYVGACSTRSGFNTLAENRYALRRLEIYGTDHLIQFIIKLKFGTNEAPLSFLPKYYYSRMKERIPHQLRRRNELRFK
jgi:peptidoglycan/xylan/chitin deacetylase (PgdA/CDA1 family)